MPCGFYGKQKAKSTFSVLGIDFTTKLTDITDININKKITEMTKALNNWSKRNLAPFGKIVVLKPLISTISPDAKCS